MYVCLIWGNIFIGFHINTHMMIFSFFSIENQSMKIKDTQKIKKYFIDTQVF